VALFGDVIVMRIVSEITIVIHFPIIHDSYSTTQYANRLDDEE